MNITGLMACTANGVIGLNGKIPWKYADELKHFQEITHKQIIIMGRKTFDEMSKLTLLKDRENIIFTRNKNLQNKYSAINITFVTSLIEFYNLKLNDKKKIYMIGGGEIAHLFLKNNLLKNFLLTHIHKEYKGDTYFPLDLIKKWNATEITKNKNYTIYQYYK